jgi:hypothetical protein
MAISWGQKINRMYFVFSRADILEKTDFQEVDENDLEIKLHNLKLDIPVRIYESKEESDDSMVTEFNDYYEHEKSP